VYNRDVHYILTKGAAQARDIPTIYSWFPRAKVILIVRDGRDAMISAKYFREFNKRPVDFEELVTPWRRMVQKYLQVRDKYPLHVMTYENLTNDSVSSITAALEYLELPYDRPMIEHINAATCFHKMTGRERGQEATGIIRKGIVGDWQDMMTSEEKDIFTKIGGEVLIELGYANDFNW